MLAEDLQYSGAFLFARSPATNYFVVSLNSSRKNTRYFLYKKPW